MADKEIYINDIKVGYATTAKVSPETNTSDTPTFDGVIADGTDTIPWTVELEKVRYGNHQQYIALEKLLRQMFTRPYPVKVVEKAHTPEGILEVKDIVYNCILDGKEYEVNADERTVESLTFKGSNCRKWINGEEII